MESETVPTPPPQRRRSRARRAARQGAEEERDRLRLQRRHSDRPAGGGDRHPRRLRRRRPVKVYTGDALAGSIDPSLSWLNPFSLSPSELSAGMLLAVFIYWGWDTTATVNEETEDPGEAPGRATVIIAVLTSAAASTQTTILPTARTTLSMARSRALPKSLGKVHPRFLTRTSRPIPNRAIPGLGSARRW